MDKKKNSKSKKIRIIKIIIFVIAGAGLLFLLYSSFINVIVVTKQASVLSEWESQKENLSEEGMGQAESVESSEVTPEDIPEGENQKSEGNIGKSGSSNVNSVKIGKENANYKDLTAEDFFPLKIRIPKIDIEWIVNEGADPQTLKEGPGHIAETPLPGDAGRSTISGHRTTYGSPFNRIDELESGDLIYLETIKGELFTYVVAGSEVVNPEDVYILVGSYKKELLLTTCYPEYSGAQRLVIIAELINLYPFELAFVEDE